MIGVNVNVFSLLGFCAAYRAGVIISIKDFFTPFLVFAQFPNGVLKFCNSTLPRRIRFAFSYRESLPFFGFRPGFYTVKKFLSCFLIFPCCYSILAGYNAFGFRFISTSFRAKFLSCTRRVSKLSPTVFAGSCGYRPMAFSGAVYGAAFVNHALYRQEGFSASGAGAFYALFSFFRQNLMLALARTVFPSTVLNLVRLGKENLSTVFASGFNFCFHDIK